MRRIAALALFIAGLSPRAPLRAAEEITRGHFYRGPGVSLLEPCGSKKGYWLDSGGAASSDLFPQYDGLTRRDYERAYVMLRGHLRALTPGEGVPTEYAGAFVTEVVLAVRAPGGDDCR